MIYVPSGRDKIKGGGGGGNVHISGMHARNVTSLFIIMQTLPN